MHSLDNSIVEFRIQMAIVFNNRISIEVFLKVHKTYVNEKIKMKCGLINSKGIFYKIYINITEIGFYSNILHFI